MVKVESVNKKGSPLENPKKKIDKMRRSQKARKLDFHDGVNVSNTFMITEIT